MAFISQARLLLIQKVVIEQQFTQNTCKGRRMTDHIQTVLVTSQNHNNLIRICFFPQPTHQKQQVIEEHKDKTLDKTYHQSVGNVIKKIYCTAICVTNVNVFKKKT